MKKVPIKIVKIGGEMLEDAGQLQEIIRDFALLEGPKILVHGGGRQASALAQKLGYSTKMIHGRRITDTDSLKVAIMTYAGLLNKELVAKLLQFNCSALGLCGADAGSIISKKRVVAEIDYGLVGDVVQVNKDFLKALLDQNIVPVYSSISCTREGQLLNTNADSIAAALGGALASSFAIELLYIFGKRGVLWDRADEDSVVKKLNLNDFREMKASGIIDQGMIPKLENAFDALDKGVENVVLGNYHLLKNPQSGTQISTT